MKRKIKQVFLTVFAGIALFTSCTEDDPVAIDVKQITLNESNIQLGLGEVYRMVATPTPENATNLKVTWSTSNEEVAQVQASENGLVAGVKGIGTGEAVITAKLGNGDTEQTVQVVVQRMYCDVSGTGIYNAESITTTGGDTNIEHSGLKPDGNYEFYSSETLTVNPGSSFTLKAIQINNWSRTMVWIDWNGDGNFNGEGELVQVFGMGSQLNDGPFNTSVNVPANTAKGAVRMRIVTGDAWTYDQIPISVCGELENSSTKDFTVEIL